MDVSVRVASCRLLYKMKRNPSYSKILGLYDASHICKSVTSADHRKGESQVNDVTETERNLGN